MRQVDPEEFLPNLSARYVYGIQSGRFIKIGVALSVAKRLHTIRLSNPHEIKVVYRRKMRAAYHCESKMHEILRPKAVGREWLEVTIEEVRAAASIGTAHAKQVYLREVLNFSPVGTPVTQAVDEVVASASKVSGF